MIAGCYRKATTITSPGRSGFGRGKRQRFRSRQASVWMNAEERAECDRVQAIIAYATQEVTRQIAHELEIAYITGLVALD